MRKLFKWLFRLAIILAIIFVALSLNATRDLYKYSAISFDSDTPFIEAEKNDFESVFKNTFFTTVDGEYSVFNPQTGLYFTESIMTDYYADSAEVSFTTSLKYAYIQITNQQNDRVTVSYFKATVIERIEFAAKYISWNL